jgi:hypothetical protein
LKQYRHRGWTSDGKQAAFAGSDGHGWRFFLQNLEGGAPRAVTPEIAAPGLYEAQLVSLDGEYVWTRDAGGKGWLYPLNGSSAAKPANGLHEDDGFAGGERTTATCLCFNRAVIRSRFTNSILQRSEKNDRKIMPEDPVALDVVTSVRVSPDGRTLLTLMGGLFQSFTSSLLK